MAVSGAGIPVVGVVGLEASGVVASSEGVVAGEVVSVVVGCGSAVSGRGCSVGGAGVSVICSSTAVISAGGDSVVVVEGVLAILVSVTVSGS